MENQLTPILVALFPRFTTAVGVVSELLSQLGSEVFAIALAESETEASAFRTSWPEVTLQPLLLLHCKESDSLATSTNAIGEIMSERGSRPLAVLLADGPCLEGFKESQRAAWNRAFSRELSSNILDTQVFEYTPTWATTPPRIR